MADNKKFIALLENYLAGKTSAEQYSELMRFIKGGMYDDLLKQKIDDALLNADSSKGIDEARSMQLFYYILNSEKQTAELISIKKISVNRRWLWIAAAAVVLIFIAISLLLPQKRTHEAMAVKSEKKMQQQVVHAKEKKYIHLQDGSTVLLNEGSRLEYPDTFKNNTREVTLIGEGYFDIQHDASRPFIVHAGKVNTTVLGTAFNIKAFPQQKEIIVTVTRGKVKVDNDKKMIGIITPNESIVVNTENKSYRQQKVNAEEVVEWKKQYLVLDDISMEDAAVLIDNKYHVNISFAKESLKDCRISATFLDNENLEQVLTVVTGVVNARYTAQPNDQIIISGEGCK
ncbi:MAG: hypothetical protein RIS73_1066 [Bacteroidota bacterium]